MFRALIAIASAFSIGTAWGQATPDQPGPPLPKKPAKGEMNKERALPFALAFLKSIGVQPGSLPVRPLLVNPVANTGTNSWFIRFGEEFEVTVNAKDGRILHFTHYRKTDDVGKIRMNAPKNNPGKRANPAFVKPPNNMLLTPDSKFLHYYQKTPIPGVVVLYPGWGLRACAIELPHGRPLLNSQIEIWIDFDPRDGSLMGYMRNLAPVIPNRSPRISSSQAARSATKSTLTLRTDSATIAGAKSPYLGYTFPSGDRGRPNRSAPLKLVWVVPSKDREIWVDASNGSPVGGKKYVQVNRGGQSNRIGG